MACRLSPRPTPVTAWGGLPYGLHRRGIRIGWWTLESGDTLGADDPSAIVRSVLRKGGAVVLLHDFDGRPERSDYVAAVTAGLLAAAREHGLRVVPLGSLL